MHLSDGKKLEHAQREQTMKQRQSGLKKVVSEIRKEALRQMRGWPDDFRDQVTRGWGQEFARQIFGGSRRPRRSR